MASFMGKVRGGFSKLVGGHKENTSQSTTKAAPGDVKAHQASKPVMDRPVSSHSPFPVAGRSVTTSATPEGVKTHQVSQPVMGKPVAVEMPVLVDGPYDRSGTAEAHQKNLETLARLVEKSIPIYEQFFGYKIADEDFIFLGENNFEVFFEDYHFNAEFRYPVENPAMNALISLLQKQPEIKKLDFTVVKENIVYRSLPILLSAVATGKVPYVTELSFKGQQIAEFGEKFFDLTKRFAGTGKVKIQIDSGVGMKKDIREMSFSDL